MSIELMTLVWKTGIGPASKRLVLLALADAASDEGVCWPLMSTIARKAGCTLSTARAAVAELEADQVVARELRPAAHERNQSNIYHVSRAALLAATEGGAAESRREGATGSRREVPPESGGSATGNRVGEPKEEPKEDTFGPADADPDKTDTDGQGPEGGVEPLFRVPASSTPSPRRTTARDIVGAYCDAYRAAKSATPPAGTLAKVGSAAKRLIDGGADLETMIAAARTLAAGPYTDLGTEYERGLANRRATPVPGPEQARERVNEWWRTGTVKEILQLTGLSYQPPDLPDVCPDPGAFHRQHRRQWITDHADEIVTRLGGTART